MYAMGLGWEEIKVGLEGEQISDCRQTHQVLGNLDQYRQRVRKGALVPISQIAIIMDMVVLAKCMGAIVIGEFY